MPDGPVPTPDRPQVPVRDGQPVVARIVPDCTDGDDNPDLVALFSLVWPNRLAQLQ